MSEISGSLCCPTNQWFNSANYKQSIFIIKTTLNIPKSIFVITVWTKLPVVKATALVALNILTTSAVIRTAWWLESVGLTVLSRKSLLMVLARPTATLGFASFTSWSQKSYHMKKVATLLQPANFLSCASRGVSKPHVTWMSSISFASTCAGMKLNSLSKRSLSTTARSLCATMFVNEASSSDASTIIPSHARTLIAWSWNAKTTFESKNEWIKWAWIEIEPTAELM